jgi:hypothetical protein
MLKLYFLHTFCHNSDVFRSILMSCRELLNINKAYIKIYIKFVCKMSADVIKSICSSAELVCKMQRL